MAFDAERWHDFYVMSGGAAAALAGLLFVAMSLHARTVMSNLFYRNRAVGMLMSLTTQLLLSAAVLVPDQPVRLLGAEVAAASLFWLGVALRAIFAREPVPARSRYRGFGCGPRLSQASRGMPCSSCPG
ncbi:MAG: hypothetical protein E6H83_13565 [Chloroflexi bacterium]|nr:MAG: hypothetical protein E6H83_13565 [Chloroflexota bacterium]